MRYADIKPNDVIGICVSLWVQGCPHHCEGCFNQETWDFNGGKEFTFKEIFQIDEYLNKEGVDRNLSILGGEPLCMRNIGTVGSICLYFKHKYPNKKIFVWTGYTYEYIKENYDAVLNFIDILIDGRFEIDKKDITLKLRGSSNQRVIDVQESLRQNKVVLFRSV